MMQTFLHENRITAILVTHSIREALLLADRIVVMAGEPGRILDIITPSIPKNKRYDSHEIEQLYYDIVISLKNR